MKKIITFIILCLLIFGAGSNTFAQQILGESVDYGHLPLKSFNSSTSFPLIFGGGKTIFVNTVNYGNTVYNYKDWGFSQGSAGDTEKFHSLSYSLLFIQQLSQNWQLIAMPEVGLAYDFENDMTSDDITLNGMLIFVRKFSETFSLGPGVVYSLRDQPVFPVPFLMFDWAPIPKVRVEGIIPASVTAFYRLHEMIELGVFIKSNGFNYHGDPDKYAVDNPWLTYSDFSAGPAVQLQFSKIVTLNLEGGYAFARGFTFYDGQKEKSSIDLDPKGYIKIGLKVGM